MKRIYIWLVITFFAACGLPNCTLVPPAVGQEEPFGTYRTFTSWRNEEIYLFNFGIHLARDPDMIGYIAFYIGKKDSRAAIDKRISKSRAYLIKTAKIDPHRLRIVCGGRADDFSQTVLNLNEKSLPPPEFGSGVGCKKP